jgi:adenine deaminase
MRFKASGASPDTFRERVRAALGEAPCDLVLRGGRVLDVFRGVFEAGTVAVKGDVLVGVREDYEGTRVLDVAGCYIVPGFVDAHVHVESSLTTPLRFQQAVLPRGTTTALWDPHEIANVLGEEGVSWALRCAEACAIDGGLDLFVLVPSCVPATHLETSGATLPAAALEAFRGHPRVLGLAEFMNVPGVLHGDDDVVAKLTAFSGGVRDGHAPQVRGKALNAYLCGGIHGCHESTSLDEAREKLSKGMHVLVREGSCAKDARELLPLIDAFTSSVLGLCSDDRNPADIRAEGHIDHIIEMGLAMGIAPELVFRVASFGAARSYGLADRGVLAPGYLADLVVVRPRDASDWRLGFSIEAVVKAGRVVDAVRLAQLADEGSRALVPSAPRRNINMAPLPADAFDVRGEGMAVRTTAICRVIEVEEGRLLSTERRLALPVRGGRVQALPSEDVLKIAVVERHHATGNVGVGFVKGFGLVEGALAASIGHDCHNVTCVGASDAALRAAVIAIAEMDGGIVVVDGQGRVTARLMLPVGGLMTHDDPGNVADALVSLKAAARALGCGLEEPFLLMSFMALPVIPSLKITDKGLVDVEAFDFVPVVCEW